MGRDANPESASTGGKDNAATRVLGAVIAARRLPPWSLRGRAGRARGDALALCLNTRPTTWRVAGASLRRPARSGLLIDLAATSEAACVGDPGLVLLMPRQMLAGAGTGRVRDAAQPVPCSAPLTVLRLLVTRLLDQDAPLTEAQARLMGRAVTELVAAALIPVRGRAEGASPWRETALLARLTAYVDAHLADDLHPDALAGALHCSRSALYRATAPAGGAAALVNQRRLAAVHDQLRDPAEARGVAEVARACGLRDPAQFSRSFKKQYGTTAAALRRAARSGGEREAWESEAWTF